MKSSQKLASPFTEMKRYTALVGLSLFRNLALGVCLLVTGKLFLAPTFDEGFSAFLALLLCASAATVVVSWVVRRWSLFASQLLVRIGLLIGDGVLVYLFANRLVNSAEGLYGLPILLAILILQDFVLLGAPYEG